MHNRALSTTRRHARSLAIALVIAFGPILISAPLSTSEAGAYGRLVPGKPFQMSVATSRQEALAAANQAARDNLPYLAQLDAEGEAARDEARSLRSRLTALQSSAAALPAGIIHTKIWMVPLVREIRGLALAPTIAEAGGTNGFSVYTYWGPSYSSGVAGYVQNFFANYPGTPSSSASASSVNSDLTSPAANPRWWDGGGAVEYIYNCVDGACTWISPSYNVQIYDDPCLNPYVVQTNPPMVCPGPNPQTWQYPRKHSRLYESQLVSAAGDFWTLGDAHHDNMGHTCVDDWDHTRDVLLQSLPPGMVMSSGYSDSGNAASTPTNTSTPPECSTHDGLEANAWLIP